MNPEQLEKELSLKEILEKAEKSLEKAKNSAGREKADAIFECEGIFIDANLTPDDLEKIGTSREDLDEFLFQADKEEAAELLEKAKSSRGREKIDAVERCKFMLKGESSKKEGVKSFTPEDINTTLQKLDELISEGEEEKL